MSPQFPKAQRPPLVVPARLLACLTFTLAFDKNRHATVRNVSKTKTTVE